MKETLIGTKTTSKVYNEITGEYIETRTSFDDYNNSTPQQSSTSTVIRKTIGDKMLPTSDISSWKTDCEDDDETITKSYEYDDSGRLTKYEDSESRLLFEYEYLTAPKGTVRISKVYDYDFGDLVKVETTFYSNSVKHDLSHPDDFHTPGESHTSLFVDEHYGHQVFASATHFADDDKSYETVSFDTTSYRSTVTNYVCDRSEEDVVTSKAYTTSFERENEGTGIVVHTERDSFKKEVTTHPDVNKDVVKTYLGKPNSDEMYLRSVRYTNTEYAEYTSIKYDIDVCEFNNSSNDCLKSVSASINKTRVTAVSANEEIVARSHADANETVIDDLENIDFSMLEDMVDEAETRRVSELRTTEHWNGAITTIVVKTPDEEGK